MKILLLLMSLAIPGMLFSAESGLYCIKVKIVESMVAIAVDVNLSTVTLRRADGSEYIVVGSSVISRQDDRTLVKNVGGGNVSLKLKISEVPSGWQVGTNSLSDVGPNKFVLATVYENWDGTPQWDWFGNEDIITTNYKNAEEGGSNKVFATSGTQQNEDGVNIPPGEEVSNFYFFHAPTSLTNSNQYNTDLFIKVTVTAYSAQ
ncbi:MAG: hypothetical protein NZ928_02425 [Endomicrobia bacterium]|nr:hypothetical protein [Endomicrobiia bacterium]